MSKKRVRSTNFNEREEDILVQCVLRHAAIVENKKTDSCTLKKKQLAWEEIGIEFNSLCPNVARQSKALKDKYTNIKTMLRKQYSRKTTDGGEEQPEWRPSSKAMSNLANIIVFSTHGTSTNFDDTESQHAIESKYTPSILRLRKPSSSQLKQPTSASSSSSRSDKADKEDSLQCMKKKLIERELEMREIEHQTRLSQQEAEHKARMALLEAQKMDFESKIELRKLKIAKLFKDKNNLNLTDSE